MVKVQVSGFLSSRLVFSSICFSEYEFRKLLCKTQKQNHHQNSVVVKGA